MGVTAIPTDATAFIQRWSGVTASELATAQPFVIELCALLEVDKPHPTPEQDYMFERPVTFLHGDGSSSAGRVDCYKRGQFVLEAKKQKALTHTKGFDDGLLRARSQGENYARALPAAEGRPPFVLVVDVGTVIEVYAEFSQSGGTYTPFPDPRSHRIKLADLAKPEVRALLRKIWTAPQALNPARISAAVTRDVAALLAELAVSLEGKTYKPNMPVAPVDKAQAAPEIVAAYLTRCLFCMFAEDVELLPKGAFVGLLQAHRTDPGALQQMLRILWADMDHGGFTAALAKNVLRFNGKLFKGSTSEGYSLLLTTAQIDLLIRAAQTNWREVEPAIFGTLLERALDPAERHAMGAHFTPRAYVERLVLPTVIEPLRAEWSDAQAAALMLAHEASSLEASPVAVTSKADFAAADRHAGAVRAKWREARQVVKDFHHRLCTVTVLDPACGSGNFLYVTLEHLKRLEGEVLNQLADLGHAGAQDSLGFEGETVTLQQLRGIEVNERAAALAELVLWIGYLQWHIRTQGNAAVAEPVVHDYGNIEHRDAVLAWDAQEPAYDSDHKLLTRWDGVTFKPHPVTGALVPDEAAQVVQWKYIGARQAAWPQAQFIVGNPPFIGAATMRAALGDGYVQALRSVWQEVPESADFVMYWWARAAALVAHGQATRFGLITTNSLRQTFNRRVVQAALSGEPVLPVNALAGHEARMAAERAGGGKAHWRDPLGSGERARGSGGRAGSGERASLVGGGRAGNAGPLMVPNAHKSVPDIAHSPACGVSLVFAIPDHPWVDSANGAAVRIAMTVGVNDGAGAGGAAKATLPARGNASEDSGAAKLGGEKLGSDPDSGQPPDRGAKPPTKSGSDPIFLNPNFAGRSETTGRLLTVTSEQTGEFGEVSVTLADKAGVIHADLSVGANVTDVRPLHANENLSNRGVQLFGAGFIVTPDEAASLGLGTVPGLERHIRDYRNGRDLTDAPRGVKVIDAFGLTAEQLRSQFPATYQWLLERVKPERDQNNRATYRDNWWFFGEPRKVLRKQLANLPRYIATVETAKHRTFQFLNASILPDNKLIAIALSDAFHLGVLSSRLHGAWALAAGSTLEDRPVYVKTTCFETFPFPDESTGLTSALRQKIASLAEQIDQHRKRVLNPALRPAPATSNSPQVGQSVAVGADLASAASMRPPQSPAVPPAAGTQATTKATKATEKNLTLTGLYNVLEALREQRPLTAKEKLIHSQGLVGVLKELHDELDAAVLQAYGVSATARVEDILGHLVTLNQQRAAEEAQGVVRWLRPEFQNPATATSRSLSKQDLPTQVQQALEGDFAMESEASKAGDHPLRTAGLGSEPSPFGRGSDPNAAAPHLAAAIHWPTTLPEQVRAVVQVLASSAAPLTLADIAARFKGKGNWKKGLPTLLETLEALGRAQRSRDVEQGDGTAWRASLQ